jgi:adenosylmethionine-8-amino-7-oxononanoate aminotransferase
VACAAANAVLVKLTDGGLVGRAAMMGEKLQHALVSTFGQHPHVGDIRGRGLFRGIELVEDRATKSPFDPKRGVAGKLKKAAFEAGLICYPMSGTIDGQRGDHILLAPPFILEDQHLDEICGKIDTAMKQAL